VESAQTIHEDYFRGCADGWRPVSGSGEPPPPLIVVPMQFLMDGKTYYESGYAKGRADAAEMITHAKRS